MTQPDLPVEPNQVVLPRTKRYSQWVTGLLLVVVFLIGIYLRFTGVNWDELRHLHPDERFLTMVESAMSPVKSLGDFFNTAKSTLNPNNVGYSYFVYGTLPIFIVRYVGEWVHQSGYDQIHLVGRQLSALADLFTVLLVYMIAVRLYNRRVGVLAAAFAACSVLPIQLSHYFTVDTFTNAFGFAAVYCAVVILTRGIKVSVQYELTSEVPAGVRPLNRHIQWGAVLRDVTPYLLFGAALGMAAASKINAVSLALLLPLVVAINLLKLSSEARKPQFWRAVLNIVIAALISLVVFRICQPYAFSGPGFFGLKLNPQWISSMRELYNQSNGDVDFPPALQWARRPVWFAWENMVKWGLGLPLGLLAWAAFLWMGWRYLKGEWTRHLPLWGWTGFYFTWQSLNWTSSMRYQMLVYPSLAVIAAWGVISLWDCRKSYRWGRLSISPRTWRILAGILGGGVLLSTFLWALAFLQIYIKPMTRVEASRWIYQNVPAPLNLRIDTAEGIYSQPIGYRSGAAVTQTQFYTTAFKPRVSGSLINVQFPSILDSYGSEAEKTLLVSISSLTDPENTLGSALVSSDFPAGSDYPGKSYDFPLDALIALDPEETYLVRVSLVEGQGEIALLGPPVLVIMDGLDVVYQSLPAIVSTVSHDQYFTAVLTAKTTGDLKAVYIPHLVDQSGSTENKTLSLQVSPSGQEAEGAVASLTGRFGLVGDGRGNDALFTFDLPLSVVKGSSYVITMKMVAGSGAVAVHGSAPALESTWDDPLPQSVDDYWPYDNSTGLYQGNLNFELYWPDDASKLKRFQTTLDQADYIFISSNRQWATTVRVPERYPLTTVYYRSLLGCPNDKEIIWCYSVVQPGMFSGTLGYELVKVSQSEPTLGSIIINSQFAEEAFSVYDHPKVLIFRKTADYQPEQVAQVLGAVDLTQVVNVTPRKTASNPPVTEMLPADREAEQLAGGTWSELFNRLDLLNRYPGIGAVVWYLAVSLLGLLAFPLVRIALPGLPDKGYPLARMVGMLLLAYLVWIAGSYEVPYTRTTIWLAVLVIALMGGVLAYFQRESLLRDFRTHWKHYLIVEAIGLGFFLFFILIRLGNPDLWHPYHGGEKPMDFSYLNAVIKSTTFPPYDPWFAGGSLNYYYYGFVIVGTLVKWLGIVPSIAYNLILPLLYSLVALGAFSLGWNIIHGYWASTKDEAQAAEESSSPHVDHGQAYLVGISASIGMIVLGNLGTVRMIWHGFQRLAANGADITTLPVLTRWILSVQGAFKFIAGARLPYGLGDWYWTPSRVFPGEPITEFPMFTFLYADLHAHMIALPITVLVLSWVLAVVLGRNRWGDENGRLGLLSVALSFLLASLAIGALKPTNSWDFPSYLILGALALVYTLGKYAQPPKLEFIHGLPARVWRLITAGAAAALLVGLSFLLYQPFTRWFGQSYNSLMYYAGSRSPFWSYITHWGLFLFVIVTWMGWETYQWMLQTPMSALNKLKPYRNLIISLLFVLVVAILMLLVGFHVQIAWFTLPLAAWAAVLLLRPGMHDIKRMILFLVGTALFLTLIVEVITLRGDLGRMNTVFKFYYQCWTLFAVSAAASLAWLLEVRPGWSKGWRNTWTVILAVLVSGASLFTIFATLDKIDNRMDPVAPHTLDGMTYMATSSYNDEGNVYSLDEDYRMIIWMQEHIAGSPVIIEGNTVEYHWGSRFTVYTGLPGVVGYNWHQRQQRASLPSTIVTDRVDDISNFYQTTNSQVALDILHKYNVSFILVGNLERANYPGSGLNKFETYDGSYWLEVHRVGNTVIYQVIK